MSHYRRILIQILAEFIYVFMILLIVLWVCRAVQIGRMTNDKHVGVNKKRKDRGTSLHFSGQKEEDTV